MALYRLSTNVTVRCKHHIDVQYFSVYIIIVNIIMHVYIKLFNLYILPMIDIVVQRCSLVS